MKLHHGDSKPVLHYTITLWFPCLDGLFQILGIVARVKKSARNHEPKASDFARFS